MLEWLLFFHILQTGEIKGPFPRHFETLQTCQDWADAVNTRMKQTVMAECTPHEKE